MKAYIYMIKNLINNKVYIGSTISPKTRKNKHLYDLKRNKHHSPHLQASYNKHGKDKFAFCVLEECQDKDRKDREIHYINEYDSFKSECGYNIYEPDENKFKCSDSTKAKLVGANLRIGRSSQVDAYLTNSTLVGSYTSIKLCSKELNVPRHIIYDVLSGKRKSYKGYTFTKQGEMFTYKPSNKQRTMIKHYK